MSRPIMQFGFVRQVNHTHICFAVAHKITYGHLHSFLFCLLNKFSLEATVIHYLYTQHTDAIMFNM